MNVTLEDNPAVMAALLERAEIAKSNGQTALAALLLVAHAALQHTHEIATTGWLET